MSDSDDGYEKLQKLKNVSRMSKKWFRRRVFNRFETADCKDGWIKIRTKDCYSLFHSLEIARMNSLETNRNKFYRYRSSPKKMKQHINNFMAECGIPANQKRYSMDAYIPIIQKFYDKQYPGDYNIYVFTRTSKPKHIFKTGDIKNKKTLKLCYDEQTDRFHVITSYNQFFKGTQNFCISCLSSYKDPLKHKNSCEFLCDLCRGNVNKI